MSKLFLLSLVVLACVQFVSSLPLNEDPYGGKSMPGKPGKMPGMMKMKPGMKPGMPAKNPAKHPAKAPKSSTGAAGPAKVKSSSGSACTNGGGTCLDSNSNSCSGGSFQTGMCPGAANIQCCIPDDGGSTYGSNTNSGSTYEAPSTAGDSSSSAPQSDADLVNAIVSSSDNKRVSVSYGGVSGFAQTPDKALIFTGKLSCDCDGYPSCPSIDPDGQTSTSYNYGGKAIDATRANYFVLPSNLSGKLGSIYKLGDIAAIMWNGNVVYAIYADNGPTDKAGEGSMLLLKSLGYTQNPNPRSTTIPSGVTYVVFPGSRSKYGSPYDLAGVAAAGHQLLVNEAANV